MFSPDEDTHVQNLRQDFELIRLHCLHIGLPKCVFAFSELEFLRHNLSSSGCSPLDKHTSPITSFLMPPDKPALQRFLGMLNFYRKFIKKAALILAPLTNALKGLVNCWIGLQHWMQLSAVLKTFSPPFTSSCIPSLVLLAVDDSDTHMGGVLLFLIPLFF